MPRSSPKITTPTLSRFEVQGHALERRPGTRPFRRPALVEAVDTGDTVAHGQHLTNFGNFSLCAEILDLLFQDRGDFRASFIVLRSPSSFVRREEREPDQSMLSSRDVRPDPTSAALPKRLKELGFLSDTRELTPRMSHSPAPN
jgi:hypothetical protein